jgi:deazaflavin-dependent oxidoreductase (nitroreductase family)
MPLPRSVARFNRRYTNRFIEPIAERSRGFAIIVHRGRSSGATYRTPVNVFRAGDDLLVALTYGPGADWVRNVLAGPGEVDLVGSERRITGVEVVGRDVAWPHLPWVVRGPLRVLGVHHFCRLSVAPFDTSQ